MRKLDEYKPGQQIEWYDTRGRWRAGVVHKICTESHPQFVTTTEITVSTGHGETKLSDPNRVRLPGEFFANEQVEVTHDGGRTYHPAAFVKHDDVKGWCQVLDGSGMCPTTTKLSNLRPLIPMEEQLAAARKSIEALEAKNKSQAEQIEELRRRLAQSAKDHGEMAYDLANTKNELEATKKALLEAARERDQLRMQRDRFGDGYWMEEAKRLKVELVNTQMTCADLKGMNENQKKTIESYHKGYKVVELEQELAQARMQLGRAMEQESKEHRLRAELDTLNARVMQAQKILEGR